MVGIFFFGVGVVPIGIFAAFFSVKSLSLGVSLIVMSLVVFAARGGGTVLLTRTHEG